MELTATNNVFSVDVEDYFQVSAFERHVPRSTWDEFPSRVVANTQRILHLLARHHVQATFFVLGWVGRRFPQLVRDILGDGHEVASHGYWHRLVYQQTPEQFRADVRASREVLQQITGAAVVAYRAPSFSITSRSLWALDILVEEGFKVDSSVFPIHHDRYGIPGAKPHLHEINTAAGPILELPPSVARVAGCNVPVGGGYFRLYPWTVSRACLRRIGRDHDALTFYVHPWEIDPDQPRIRGVSRLARFRHYINLHTTEPKLEQLLRAFPFGTLSTACGLATSTDRTADRASS